MKILKRRSGSQRLVSEIQLARTRLARAESKLELAQEQAREAKRRRKEAKQAARRAKKQAQHAKEEFAAAKQALDDAEERFAKTGKRAGKIRKSAKKKPVVKAVAAKSGKGKPTIQSHKTRKVSSPPGRARRNSHASHLKNPPVARAMAAKRKRPARVAQDLAPTPAPVATIIEKENLVPEGYVIEQLGESSPAGSNPSETH